MSAIYSGTDSVKAYQVAAEAEKEGKRTQVQTVRMGRGSKSYSVYHVYVV